MDAGAKSIEITLKQGGLAKLSVKDDGSGISESDAAQVAMASPSSTEMII